MKTLPRLTRLLMLGVVVLPLWAGAAEPSAAGLWRQIDDTTGKVRSLLRVDEQGGLYEGRIDKIYFNPDETERDPVCDKCSDARKGQKLIGMTILTGLKRSGLSYEGGEILDPDNGKIYRARMNLSADGKTLEVRGFIGVSLFGRSQTWLRQP